MIGVSPQESQNSVAMANNVSFASQATTPLSGIDILPHDVFNSKHSIFSAKVINRTAFESHVWIIDTGVVDHIVCSVSMLTSITSISHCVVKFPNGEFATVTHVGTNNFLLNLLFTMLFVFLVLLLTFCQSANSQNNFLFVLFFYLNFVSFRFLPVRGRLEWVRCIMVCTCCRKS